ncbi:hypothetical protein HGA92_02240 [Candidatus Gracilibacteria bacterium]|nr:hypothetical protein [Candidatus Gracilibacteria bacterium]NUJ99406.1 hypothetical protein [Candidatus Gracilibacteria bacterium]
MQKLLKKGETKIIISQELQEILGKKINKRLINLLNSLDFEESRDFQTCSQILFFLYRNKGNVLQILGRKQKEVSKYKYLFILSQYFGISQKKYKLLIETVIKEDKKSLSPLQTQ